MWLVFLKDELPLRDVLIDTVLLGGGAVLCYSITSWTPFPLLTLLRVVLAHQGPGRLKFGW